MESKKAKKQLILALNSVLAALVGITVVTYAWFTFGTTTNIEPMSSTISKGDAELLISNAASGPFDKECTLVFDANPTTLSPVSTADLQNFYQTTAQNSAGISILYRDVTSQISDYLINGIVYLESLGGTNRVYFYPSAFELGADAQTRAALRLGMRITVNGQSSSYLFRLDGLINGTAENKLTVPNAGTIVSSINSSGNAAYTADLSQAITDYMAVEKTANDPSPQAGNKLLCTLLDQQIAVVQYWVYLEGCDENCINSVQSKDFPIRFGFAGVPQEGQ